MRLKKNNNDLVKEKKMEKSKKKFKMRPGTVRLHYLMSGSPPLLSVNTKFSFNFVITLLFHANIIHDKAPSMGGFRKS
jgi:hypothetical protein